MGVRITSQEDPEYCNLFDSVTGWAFGPVFHDQAQAEAFLDTHYGKEGLPDLRSVTQPSLESYYYGFRVAYDEWLDTETKEAFPDWVKGTDHWADWGSRLAKLELVALDHLKKPRKQTGCKK